LLSKGESETLEPAGELEPMAGEPGDQTEGQE
jgi:hypothetical protein